MCFKLTNEIFIEKANKIHNFNYDYSNVNYVNNKTKVEILCKKHGIFEQRPDSHLRGIGCSICGEEKFKITQRKNIKNIIDDFNKYHNFSYDYSLMIYKNAHSKVFIICNKCKKIFKQTPNTHLRCGCPFCKESKGEKSIKKILLQNNIFFETQKKFVGCAYKSKLSFDFYLPIYNLCIEFDGEQHYRNVKLFGGEREFKLRVKRDKIKNDFCIKNNILLLRIKYNENIEEKINIFLKNNFKYETKKGIM